MTTNTFVSSFNVRARSKLRTGLLAAILSFTFVGVALTPPKAEASGFPTVDIVALIQRILGYITQIEQYAEQLTTSTSTVAELVQMYQDYQQVLTEYNHYLAQIRGLQSFLSPTQWDQLMQGLAPYYGNSLLAGLPVIDYRTPTFKSDVYTALQDSGMDAPQTDADLRAALATTSLADPSNILAANAQSQAFMKRELDNRQIVSANSMASNDRVAIVQQYANAVQNLGDESDVATMQLIATEMATMLQFQNEQMNIQNQLLASQQLESTQRAADRAAAVQKETKALQDMSTRTYPVPTFQMTFE